MKTKVAWKRLHIPRSNTDRKEKVMLMLDGFILLLSNFLFLFLKISDADIFPPPLSSAEEAECFRKMRHGDRSAREKLIKHNLRLVAHIVKKYYTGSKNQDDLISTGTIGLIKAVDSFDTENGTRFATYASKCLQNEILMQFRSQKKLQYEVSINETIDTDKDGNPLAYGDVIAVEDSIVDDLDLKMKGGDAVRFIMREMSGRERDVMKLRYGIGRSAPLTQRECAVMLGISRSYVSRIEKSALEKLKAYMKLRGYE